MNKPRKPVKSKTQPEILHLEEAKAHTVYIEKPHRTQAVTVTHKIIEERRREESTLLAAIVSAASNPAVDVDKMERLWIIHKEAQAARAEQEFSMAKNALALEIPPIPKRHKISFVDKNGVKQETPYANREDIEAIIGPIYRRHGFSTEYSTFYIDGKIQTAMTLRHTGGHKGVYHSAPMPLDTTGSKNNNQAAGSTSEYGMRYCLKGAFNIIGIDTDDDGAGGKDKGNTGDKFAERVGEEADKKDLEGAAQKLTDKLRAATAGEKRGQILMNNLKLIGALEAGTEGQKLLAQSIRKLAEEEPTNGS